jgi:hypothetical protein
VQFLQLWIPTLLSYFVFEWLMLAKRRRDLILALQQCSYRIYAIDPGTDVKVFPRFDANTLNVLPFSLMDEVVSIGERTKFNLLLVRVSVGCIFIFLIGAIGFSFYESISSHHMEMKIHFPVNAREFLADLSVYASTILCFIFWILLYFIKMNAPHI